MLSQTGDDKFQNLKPLRLFFEIVKYLLLFTPILRLCENDKILACCLSVVFWERRY